MKKYLSPEVFSLRFWLVSILVVLILLYSIFIYVVHTGCGVSYLLTSICFALPLSHLLCSIRNRIALGVVMGLLLLISMVETGMVLLFDNFVVAGNILAIFTTNSQEGGDFIATNLSVGLYFLPLIGLYIALLYSWEREAVSVRAHLLLALVWVCISFGYVGYKQWGFYEGKLTWRYYIEHRIWNRPPYNFFYQLNNVAIQLNHRRALRNSEHQSFDAVRDTVPTEREIYVLGIGESCRYANLSLNGKYTRETTPLLAQTPNLLLFDNYYSSACLTMFSVPQIVTRATPDNYELNFQERTVASPFAECGFKTYVIVHNSNLLSYEKYLSRDADSLILVSADSVIPILVDSLSQLHPKTFFVVEFLGNHHSYYNYTEEFDRYHPNAHDENPPKSDSLYINAYDNSLLYTDYILHKLITAIDKPDTHSGFIFVSDHGENVTATGGGHGGDCSPIKTEYHVPLIVWNSETWIHNNPQKYAVRNSHKESPLNGDNIFYSVCDMAGITLFANDSATERSQEQEARSIFSPAWCEHERLVLLPDGISTLAVP